MTSTLSTRPNQLDDIEILCALGTVHCPVSVVLVVVVALTGFDLWDSTKSCSACVELMYEPLLIYVVLFACLCQTLLNLPEP